MDKFLKYLESIKPIIRSKELALASGLGRTVIAKHFSHENTGGGWPLSVGNIPYVVKGLCKYFGTIHIGKYAITADQQSQLIVVDYNLGKRWITATYDYHHFITDFLPMLDEED